MIKKLIGVVLLAGTMAFAEDVKPTQTASPVPMVQVDSVGLIKAHFKAYQLQMKQAMKLAKAQTRVALEQFKLQQVNKVGQERIQIETIKAGK